MEDTERIEQRVYTFMEKHRMLSPGEKAVVGVSGGADSVCLLFLLSGIASRKGISLHVVHINHGIRQEAGADAAFVKKLCRGLGIPFTLAERDVRKEAKIRKLSEEETGRMIRYETFQQTAAQIGAQKIAVAHNGNDQAETMLFHLFRGSALSGLCGIRPVRGNIIRPLLCLERREIEGYLREKGIPYCVDSTNEEDAYTRNRIRHHILPYAEEQVAVNCVAHMGRTALFLQEMDEYLDRQARQAYGLVAPEDGTLPETGEAPLGAETAADKALQSAEGQACGNDMPANPVRRINRTAFLGLDPVVGKRLLRNLLRELSPSGKDISSIHIEELLSLFFREGNGSVDLPYHIRGRRQYDEVILERFPARESLGNRQLSVRVKLPLPGEEEVVYPVGGEKAMGFQSFELKNFENIPKKKYTKWFDYDKINEFLTVRPREEGDYLTLRRGSGGWMRQTLKRFMINEKIPAQMREQIPVLAEGRHILWVTGYRISEFYKVGRDTRVILQARLLKYAGEGLTEAEEELWQSI